jgi:o-succinylbenzoate---CoA ligase
MERAQLRQWALSAPGATALGDFVFLCDPSWGALERQQAAELMALHTEADPGTGWLCIPTGGTSGRVRFARHDEETLQAAVSGFLAHFGMAKASALGVLPLHHVSGFMARLRCLISGGQYVEASWKGISSGAFPSRPAEGHWSISLVPTQLQRLLELPGGAEFLRAFDTVLVGGGPIWEHVAEQATRERVPIALCYGMTETAAMVTAQKPGAFLRGERDVGFALSHASVELIPDSTGIDGKTDVGRIAVGGRSVFRGYFPATLTDRRFITDDMGSFATSGALQVLGRRDSVIISGGKKIWPAEVEEVLLASGAFSEVAVIGVPDPNWGQMVVACHPGGMSGLDLDRARAALDARLARYKHPKRFLAVKPWPRNEQGKVSRAALLNAAVRES